MGKLISLFHFQENKILSWKKSFLGPFTNKRGQTLITWLMLLVVVITVAISFGSAFNMIQDRMQIMNVCRLQSLKTQQDAEPFIRRLFALNPEARLLRILLVAAKVRLAAAVSHYNVPMAIRARYEISQIRRQQNLLDRTQRLIVQTANIKLHTGTLTTYIKLKSTFQEIKNKSAAWAEIDFVLQNPRIPKLAVKREDDNLAPPYLARDNFEKQQVTAQSWSQSYRLKGFLKFTHNSKSQCHATLEENSWVPKIRRDKL